MEYVIYEDKKMKILWANRAACEAAGIEQDDISGRYCYEIWAQREDVCPDCPVQKASWISTGAWNQADRDWGGVGTAGVYVCYGCVC